MKKTSPLAIVLLAVLAWLVVYPLLIVAGEAFRADFGAFIRSRTEWGALWASVWTSAASVALAGILGVPLAFVFERYDFPGRKTLGSLVALPAVMPPLVGVIAFQFLYGESGFISRFVQAALRLQDPPWRLQGAGAILLVHAYSMYVYFYLFARAGLQRMDASMVEAAQSLGAGPVRTFRRVTLPLLKPALMGASLLTFMTALASFSAPYIFGGGFRTMTTQIVATKLNGDDAMAMLETAALTLIAVLVFLAIRRTEGNRLVVSVGKGTPPALKRIESAAARRLAAASGWLLTIVLLLPHATLLLVSLVPQGTWTVETLPPAYSLANYGVLLEDAERLRPLVNSLWMASVATLAALGLALLAGQLVVKREARFKGAIEALVTLPWAVPGTVLAIALAALLSVRSLLTLRWVLVGTAVILPLAYTIRNLPLTARAVFAGFRQLDPTLDEAAQSLGAGRVRRMMRVTLPLLKPALAAGGGLAFVTALGDFVVSILLYTYTTRPISIEILSSLRLGDVGVAAAFGVVLMVVSAIALGVSARVGAAPAGGTA